MRTTDAIKIILVSGSAESGKSALAGQLKEHFGAHVVDAGRQKVPPASVRVPQRSGNRKPGGKWILEILRKVANDDGRGPRVFVVDSVTTKAQVGAIRRGCPNVTHVHLVAGRGGFELGHDGARIARKAGAGNAGLERIADCVIRTERCTPKDVMTRVAAHARLYGESGYVDVIVGGQYGSEGKGQVASHLAKEYDLLVRVGGPNAGHKVPKPKYTYHHLPSGTQSSDADLLLGPGAVIDPAVLLKEIADCGVTKDRLSIDPQAMIIDECDKKNEDTLVRRIGSTGSGVGSATARKIWRKRGVTLAKDVDELKPYVKEARRVIDDALAHGGRIMLEGAQGSMLSIHHGKYPHVTSRETNAAGCLADAGIPPSLVRRVIMVVRTYPIRVGSGRKGTSGPLSQELDFETISKRSGKPLKDITDTEVGSTTGKKRRIGEFEWDMLRDAAFLNRPTDIALTFTDYMSNKNSRAQRFIQLTKETIEMVQEIERVSGARVSMIATGFGTRSIIDRRSW